MTQNEDILHYKVKLGNCRMNWRRKEIKVWLMRQLSVNLKRCWEREFRNLIVVIMIWNKLLRRSKLLRKNLTSWRISLITREEKVQSTKTSFVNSKPWLQKSRKSYKTLNKLSFEEIAISEESRRLFKMREERACLMSKRYVSLRNNLRLRLSKLVNSMKSSLMSKIGMNYLLRKSRDLDRKWRRNVELPWLRINM